MRTCFDYKRITENAKRAYPDYNIQTALIMYAGIIGNVASFSRDRLASEAAAWELQNTRTLVLMHTIGRN